MKLRLLFTVLFLSAITLAQVPTNGLVKEYNFITGPGVQLTDSNHQTTLQSGVVNLTRTGLSGSLTTDRIGNPSRAMLLNGDYFYSGGTEQTYVNEYTISFWVKSTTIDNTNSKFILHQKGSSPQHGFSVELNNGQILFYNIFGYGNTSITDVAQVYVNSNTNVADGNWHHVVCAVNSTATSMVFSPYVTWTINYYSKVYVDNVLVGNANQTVTPSYTSGQIVREAINRNQPFYIGSYPGNTTEAQKYKDIIDQVKYYERELNLQEITQLFNEEHPEAPIYVNVNATGNNDGTSWVNAYTDLESAINNNIFNDEIWVAAGTYKHSSTDRITSIELKNNTKLFGGFIGTETLLSERNPKTNITIISGDVLGNDNANPATILNTESTRQDNKYHVIQLKNSVQNVIVDGFTISGGNANGTTATSGIDQYYRTRGGAIQVMLKAANEHVSATFKNCVFERNSASETGVFGIYYYNGVTNMSNDVKFESCLFKNNFSSTGSTVQYVGAKTFNWLSSGKIVNCLFFDNVSNGDASCVYFFASTTGGGQTNLGLDVSIINSTFSNNTGLSGRVIRTDNGGNTKVFNSIIWGNNSGSPFYSSNSMYSITDSNIVQGGIYGANTNPLFNPDYTLQSSSPAINSGHTPHISSIYATDLAGNNRFVGTVDKGAYEYDAALSLENPINSQNSFKIYPNPTSGNINVVGNEQIKHISLYSFDGKLLLETQNTFLDISIYPSGIYLLYLESENGIIQTQKIIKK